MKNNLQVIIKNIITITILIFLILVFIFLILNYYLNINYKILNNQEKIIETIYFKNRYFSNIILDRLKFSLITFSLSF